MNTATSPARSRMYSRLGTRAIGCTVSWHSRVYEARIGSNTLKSPMTATKKVLFLITKATWGGAQRYVHDLARSLPQNEFTPALVYGVEGRLAELCQNDGIRIRQI